MKKLEKRYIKLEYCDEREDLTHEKIISLLKKDFKTEDDLFEINEWTGKNDPHGKGKRISFYAPPEYFELLEEAKKLSRNPKYKNLSSFIMEALKEKVFEDSGREELVYNIKKTLTDISGAYRKTIIMEKKCSKEIIEYINLALLRVRKLRGKLDAMNK